MKFRNLTAIAILAFSLSVGRAADRLTGTPMGTHPSQAPIAFDGNYSNRHILQQDSGLPNPSHRASI